MIRNPLLRRFLGLDRIALLGEALKANTSALPGHGIGLAEVTLALAIASLPFLSFFARNTNSKLDITTAFVGIATVLAILFRVTRKIPFYHAKEWRRDISLTHTAFAIGCIPAVLIVLIDPEALSHLNATKSAVQVVPGARPSSFGLALFVLKVAVWAGLTEEIIFRGMLISVLRRWQLLRTQRARDTLAVVVSATMFGLSHLPVWGPSLSLALVGLGVGFGAAYLAIGEAIMPLVLYHIIFDVLSLTAAYVLR